MQKENFEKQIQLEKCIKDMSKSVLNEKDIDDMIGKLRILYDGKFRHAYAKFFNWLLDIKKEEQGNFEYLSENLLKIQEKASEKTTNDDAFLRALDKLTDHINLEIGRINHDEVQEKRFLDISRELDDAQKKVKEANRKASSMQKEYVAILGIFASVVVTFMGGLSFSTAALENINNANIYKVLLMVLTIGLVLVNALYGLFYFINMAIKSDEDKTMSLEPLKTANRTIATLMGLISFFYIAR